jgi:hypothetical protein
MNEDILLNEPFTTESLASAIRKKDADFLNWLNPFLDEMKVDGKEIALKFVLSGSGWANPRNPANIHLELELFMVGQL